MSGAVAPDLDYIYLESVNPVEPDHHLYFTHFPLFWGFLLLLAVLWLVSERRGQKPVSAFMFSLGGLIHMPLDVIPGHIYWLAPFSFRYISLETLIEMRLPSMLEYLPYVDLGIESMILFIAARLWLKRDRGGRYGIDKVDPQEPLS